MSNLEANGMLLNGVSFVHIIIHSHVVLLLKTIYTVGVEFDTLASAHVMRA